MALVAVYDAFKAAGTDDRKAVAAVEAIENHENKNMETKIDSLQKEVRSGFDSMSKEIASVRSETKADIDSVRREVKADIGSVRSDIKTLKWAVGIIAAAQIATIGLMLATIGLLIVNLS